MRMCSLLTSGFIAVATLSALADSIDDAEAKRRGVPVSQVQAENALSKEKLKTAALEKQIADLKKQISVASGNVQIPGVPSTSAVTRTASGAAKPITGPVVATAPLNFDGPREDTPFYVDMVTHYLSGDWATLAADLAARQKEIDALPAGNLADLTYIRRAIVECRPAWWDEVKKGKPTQFRQLVWNHPVTVDFTNSEDEGYGYERKTNGVVVTEFHWPSADMDSKSPMPMTYVGIANFDPNNYVISDGITADIWHAIGLMQFRQDLFDRIQTMNRMETQQFDNYLYFRANLVSAYYGTPPARRLRLIQSFASLSLNGSTSPDHNGRRPLGASFLIDMRTHIENYKSLHATPSEFEEFALRDNAEYRVGDSIVSRRLLNIRFNLTEDRLIRDMAKNLADANPDWRVSKIKLPNGFYIELDPEKDSDFRTERLAYLRTGPVATQKSP